MRKEVHEQPEALRQTIAGRLDVDRELAVDDLPDYPIRRDSVRTDSKRAIVDRVGEVAAAEYDDVSTLDGVRVETDAGWFLVRASGTEALVRITAEARDKADADALFETARDLVAGAAADLD